MFSLAVAVLLVALDITIVTTALPTISEEFNSASGYTWVGSAYLIAQSAATPIWGKVSDIFGRKPILLVTNAIFFVGSLLAGVSVNIDMLIAARAVQGIGGGGLITLVNIAISDLFSVRDRGMYFGIIGGVWALASSLGPVVGGLFTQKVSWRLA
jgi:MFS family permease